MKSANTWIFSDFVSQLEKRFPTIMVINSTEKYFVQKDYVTEYSISLERWIDANGKEKMIKFDDFETLEEIRVFLGYKENDNVFSENSESVPLNSYYLAFYSGDILNPKLEYMVIVSDISLNKKESIEINITSINTHGNTGIFINSLNQIFKRLYKEKQLPNIIFTYTPNFLEKELRHEYQPLKILYLHYVKNRVISGESLSDKYQTVFNYLDIHEGILSLFIMPLDTDKTDYKKAYYEIQYNIQEKSSSLLFSTIKIKLENPMPDEINIRTDIVEAIDRFLNQRVNNQIFYQSSAVTHIAPYLL